MSEDSSQPSWDPLPRDFYLPTARKVAPALLGHFLVRQDREGPCAGVIVETEAYLAHDPSCHGYARQTARNRSMYGPPGHAYVYFIYGNHFCFNAVCGPEGVPEAVLVRAIQPLMGLDLMCQRRKGRRELDWTSGPGRLCEALHITRPLDGADLCNAASPVFIARNPEVLKLRRALGPLVRTRRIGISVATHWLLRFYLDGSAWVSKRR